MSDLMPPGRDTGVLARLAAVLGSPWVRRVFLVLAVAAAVSAVVLERESVGAALRQVSWGQVVLATMLSLLTVVFAMLSWRAVGAGLGAPLGLREAAVVYLVGQVGKYLPGGVWNLVASAELGRDRGIERRRTVGSMVLAVMVSAAMGGLLVLLTLPGLPGGFLEDLAWLTWLAPLTVVVVLPPVLNRVLALLLRLTRQAPVAERIRIGAVAASGAWAVASWLAVGAQVLVLALAVGAEPDATLVRAAVGGYAVAWVVGFVLVFLPAGVGAREGVLALALSPVLGAGGVLVVVLLCRVLLTVADLVAAALALLVARRPTSRRP